METISWLINLCVKHQREFKKKMNERGKERSNTESDADFELIFHTLFVEDFASKPSELENISNVACLMLAYFTKLTLGGDSNVLGYEILDKLQTEEAIHTATYLEAYDELENHSWIVYNFNKSNILQIKPYSWMQTRIDFGSAIEMLEGGNLIGQQKEFFSNDELLECIFDYLSDYNPPEMNANSNDVDNSGVTFSPDRSFRRIQKNIENSKVELPAFDIMKTYNLSGYQFLYVIGLFAQQEKASNYDFTDIEDTSRFFTKNYSQRIRMKKHLVGDDSPLITKRLIEGKSGQFGKEYKLTPATARLILGKKIESHSVEELTRYVNKTCIFDVETPKVKKGSLLLPPEDFEVMRLLNFSRLCRNTEDI